MKKLFLIATLLIATLSMAPSAASQSPAADAGIGATAQTGATVQTDEPATATDAAAKADDADVAAASDAAKADAAAAADKVDAEHPAAADNEAEEAANAEGEKKGMSFDPKEIIFEHLGDRYGWEVPFCHSKSIPLPVILWASDGLHIFSSARIDHHHPYQDGDKIFVVPSEGSNKGKCVEVVGGKIVDGHVVGGEEVKPFDLSITKNVCAIFIAVIVILALVLPLARYYKKHGYKAPRKMKGAIEALVEFVYDGVIRSTLKDKASKFAPYLLTVFFFIFIMNLLGLLVVFPGGANVTGNIGVTLVLALLTFFITNIFGTKHYWKEILWPDVPLWLKFPLPIMPVIEIFGMFTKPAALTVRLFANMMGGHMIVIVLTLIIFIFFEQMGVGAASGTTVVSIIFSVFMLCIDVLVSFIQAYVFTMLSTIFIYLAQEQGEHEAEKHEKRIAKQAEATK